MTKKKNFVAGANNSNTNHTHGSRNEQKFSFLTEKQLYNYFNKVAQMQQSGIQFPVDLDEVFPIAYSQKGKAMEVLKNEFIEGEDFNLSQKGKVVSFNELQNGVKITVKISISAMEYLIVRKVRPVFEVYRRVFHSINTPINGILPIYHNGKLGYPRKQFLISIGRSYRNGYRLRKRFPEDCFAIGNTSCISSNLAHLLQDEQNLKNRALQMKSNQLNLAL